MKNKSVYTAEEIDIIVNKIMEEHLIIAPHDYTFQHNTRKYPKLFHKAYEMPGIFVNKEDARVFFNGKQIKEVNYIESVKPDGNLILRNSSQILEQVSGMISSDKKKELYDYVLRKTPELEKPCYLFVATDYPYKENEIYIDVEGKIERVFLRVFDCEKIENLLNTIKEIGNSQIEFTPYEYGLYIQCLVHSRTIGKEITEELSKEFSSRDNIPQEFKEELYRTLCRFIKYYFIHDVEKTRELIKIITKAMPSEIMEDLVKLNYETAERIEMLEKIKIKIKIIEIQNKEIKKLQEEKEELLRELEKYNG